MNLKEKILVSILTLSPTTGLILAESKSTYGSRGTIELAGTATISYTNAPNSRTATQFFSFGMQPTLSYFFADSWFVGTGIQGNLFYSNYSGSSWNYVGELSGLVGKTISLKPDIYFYGQLEAGTSLPYIQDNGLSTRYYFMRPTVGLKFLINSVIINTNLKYTFTQLKNSYDADYFILHNLQLGVGIGFYF